MAQLAQSNRRRQIGSGMSHMIRTQPRESFNTWLITCIFPCSPLWQLINTRTRAIQESSRGYLCQEERPWGFWQGHDALYSQNLNICFHFNCKLKHIVETTEQLHKRQASHTFGPMNFHDLSGNEWFPKRRSIKNILEILHSWGAISRCWVWEHSFIIIIENIHDFFKVLV